ncbi:PAS domain-containing sensor histidine kinase [Dyadobacter sediminis]|uniref:histidine kinase n=1 Tax=Dyadobacter sediminis TaxID=1493691 RepID=A0A5R9KQD6_9BACT|nr:PAS domain-containing protein [Dyadobacter sediminis]TLU98359.1 PAS domain S-box protein [Dyadobacter sediminis]GGC14595.1 hypothetical protein GCM10011325_46860 [Dyadobacter sediminis]
MAQEVTEQVLNRRKLEESESRFRLLIQQAPVATSLYVGSQLRIEVANLTMLSYWDKDQSVIGKTFREAMPELQGQGYFEILDEVFKTAEAYQMHASPAQVSIGGKAGRYYFDLSFKPLLDTSGQVYAILNTAYDVTSQVEERQQKEKEQQQVLALFEQSPVEIAMLSPDGFHFKMSNPFYNDLVGRTSGQLLGRPLLEAIPELQGQGFDRLLRQVVDSGVPFVANEVAVKLVRSNELQTVYLNLTFQPQRHQNNNAVTAILVVATDVTLQVHTQQQIQQKNLQLHELLENTPDVITRWDKQRRLVFANQAFSAKTGTENTGLLGKTNLEMGQPTEVAVPYMDRLQQVLDSRQPAEHYNAFPAPVGLIQYHSRMVPEFDADGQLVSVLSIARDITELKVSEDRFRSLIQQAPIATSLLVGPEFIVEVANPIQLAHWGKDIFIIGKPLIQVLPELKDQSYLQVLEDVFTSGNVYSNAQAKVLLNINGMTQTHYFDLTYKPLLNASGQVYSILAMSSNITQQVLTRQELAEKSQDLELAMNIGQLGSFKINLLKHTATYSRLVMDWFNLQQQGEALPAIFSRIHEDDRAEVMQNIEQSILGENNGYHDLTFRVWDSSANSWRHLHSVGQTQLESGVAVSLSGIIQDVTNLVMAHNQLQESESRYKNLSIELEQRVKQRTRDLQIANQDLMRSNQDLQQFAYISSHDLQEPLRKIQSLGTMLEQRFSKQLGIEGKQLLDRMIKSGARMSNLIHDLLAFSYLSAKQQHFDLVSLDEILTDVINKLDLEIAERQALIEVNTLGTVQGDKSQLGQLFQNLVSNAIKFTLSSVRPHVRIECFQRSRGELPSELQPGSNANQFIQISISDNGVGFDTYHLDRIFQMFQRLHTRSEFPGTGIGLAICKRVVENHGGGITANSKPGKGATFCIYLPLQV